ncbi:MAG: ATP phosphoribosyltransferase [Bacteroidales bacterium]|nr:ATP phosphoribosyltransferase [Bacteroidales bacterium]
MLRIAIQAKGRLNEDSVRLLADAGITISGSQRRLMARAKGFPIDVLYLRDDDIPQAVCMGVADLGIVGANEVAERHLPVEEVMKLGFSECRISIALPREVAYEGPQTLAGKRIATSYPHILSQWLHEHNIPAEIHEIAGSVEVAPAVGMADAIFDIVSSGGTLIQNGLVEVEQVFFSEAVLIATPGLSDEKQADLERLKFRFNSIVESRGMKYVLLNLPEASIDQAVALLPGMKSPTLLPLAEKGWYSLHAVIKEDTLWDKIHQLKEIGAEDILVLSLENLIR